MNIIARVTLAKATLARLRAAEGIKPDFVIWSFDSEGHRSYHIKLLVHWALVHGLSPGLVIADSGPGADRLAKDFGRMVLQAGKKFWNENPLLIAISTNQLSHTAQEIAPNVCLSGDKFFPLLPVLGALPARVVLVRSPLRKTAIDRRFRRRLLRILLPFFEVLGIKFLHLVGPGEVFNPDATVLRDPPPFLLDQEFEGGTPLQLASQKSGLTVGLFGSIGPRKQPDLLLEACALISGSRILVVGKWESLDLLEKFKRKANRLGVEIQIINRFTSDSELCEAMESVTIVAVLNTNEGSSGIALGAAQLGKSLILSGSESNKLTALALDSRWVPSEAMSLAKALVREAERPKDFPKKNLETPKSQLPSLEEFGSTVLGVALS